MYIEVGTMLTPRHIFARHQSEWFSLDRLLKHVQAYFCLHGGVRLELLVGSTVFELSEGHRFRRASETLHRSNRSKANHLCHHQYQELWPNLSDCCRSLSRWRKFRSVWFDVFGCKPGGT